MTSARSSKARLRKRVAESTVFQQIATLLEALELVLVPVPQLDELLCLSNVSSSPMIPPSSRINCHVNRPGVLTRKDSTIPIIGVGEISAMPCKGKAFIDGFHQLLVSTLGIGVSHIIQYGDGELGWVSGSTRSGEAHDLG